MPRRKWIDKNSATTYQLVHRSQNDPLIHDENAQDRVFHQISGPSTGSSRNGGLHLADLENGTDLDFESMRENEGEAANYGIYFDDTEYDYMQHLRGVGEGSGEAHFIDATPVKPKSKGKDKIMRLEDALRLGETQAESIVGTQSVWDEDMSYMSATRRERTYQDQQDVPDEIAGFQPDMDPRLREVLEALEDDAYIDDNDKGDMFGELAKNGKDNELDMDEFMLSFDEDDDDEGWESDVTEKPAPQRVGALDASDLPILDNLSLEERLSDLNTEAAVAEDGDWMREFAKYKQAMKSKPVQAPAVEIESIAQAPFELPAPSTLYTLGGTPLRKKKRKGALTNPSAYSMTSSSLARTDGQLLLDDRFERIEKLYRLDEDDAYLDDDEDGGMSLASGRTGMSKMSGISRMSGISTRSFADGPAREDMDSMMDGFLKGWDQGHPVPAKRKGKKGRKGGIGRGDDEVGVQTLDAVRQALGPGIVPKAYRA